MSGHLYIWRVSLMYITYTTPQENILMDSDTSEGLVRRAIYEIQAVGGEAYIYIYIYIYVCNQPRSVLVTSENIGTKEL